MKVYWHVEGKKIELSTVFLGPKQEKITTVSVQGRKEGNYCLSREQLNNMTREEVHAFFGSTMEGAEW